MSRPDTNALTAAASSATSLKRFLDQSPCSFHAVASITSRLDQSGFKRLDEASRFRLEPGGKYYVVRGASSVIAFWIGAEPPSETGFNMIGAHTDSPGFKLKPNPDTVEKEGGLVRLSVEVYGGPLRVTWMDRDLGLCGRVVIASANGTDSRLYKTREPLISIPNVAIHLNRDANDKGLTVNPQTELAVILGTAGLGLSGQDVVKNLVAHDLGLDKESILAMELFLFDTQPAQLGGASGEFIRSGRIDDLAMCHAGLEALVAAPDDVTPHTRVLACLDSEEIGSQTRQGARSTFLPAVLERISLALGDDRDGFWAALARSTMLSADNAHARHPGYASRHDPEHAPLVNMGPVLKAHASRAYATDADAAALFELCCKRAGVPMQKFANRSDYKSGSTIGSMTAAQLGVPVADIGIPQLAMHSVRELAGVLDHYYMIQAMRVFLEGI